MTDNYRPLPSTGTAQWVAAARAQESERSDRLFDDPYAAVLAGTIGREALAASEAAIGGPNEFLPIRTRFFDELVGAEVGHLGQVVLLGAGLDTRAFRLELPARLRWFEIDRPDLFDAKEHVLADVGAMVGCERTVVRADFSGTWVSALVDAGFEAGRRTLWLAEGLLFYLSASVIADVLRETCRLSGEGSIIAADVFGSGLLRLPAMAPALAARIRRGLPPPFTTDDPVADFRAAGWAMVELERPARLGPRYGRALAGRAPVSAGLTDPTLQTYLVVARTAG